LPRFLLEVNVTILWLHILYIGDGRPPKQPIYLEVIATEQQPEGQRNSWIHITW